MKDFESIWLYTVAGSEEVPAEVLAQLYPDAVLYGPNYDQVLKYANSLTAVVAHHYPYWLLRDLINLQVQGITVINTELIMNRKGRSQFHEDRLTVALPVDSAGDATVRLQESLQELVNDLHITPDSYHDYQKKYLHNILMSCFYVLAVKGNYSLQETESLAPLSDLWDESVKETFNMIVKLVN